MTESDTPRVLFVDDEHEAADMYAAQVAGEYDVEIAYDGQTALEVVDDSFDVVFLDRDMPGLTGDSVLDAIRDRGLDVQVVMLTGIEPDEDIVDMGYDEYVLKPVVKEDLTGAVERLIADHGEDVNGEILDALGDPKTRRCCSVLVREPLSAKELAEATGFSLTTVYRRLNALQQADIIEARDTVDPDGDHYKRFSVVSTRIRIDIDDAVSVDVERRGSSGA